MHWSRQIDNRSHSLDVKVGWGVRIAGRADSKLTLLCQYFHGERVCDSTHLSELFRGLEAAAVDATGMVASRKHMMKVSIRLVQCMRTKCTLQCCSSLIACDHLCHTYRTLPDTSSKPYNVTRSRLALIWRIAEIFAKLFGGCCRFSA